MKQEDIIRLQDTIEIGEVVRCTKGIDGINATYGLLVHPTLATIIDKDEHFFTVVHHCKKGSYRESFRYIDLLLNEGVERL